MADRLHERLRELGETFGLTGRALEVFVEGSGDPHDPAVTGRELFSEAQASRFAQDVGGAAPAGRGSVLTALTALTEAFQQPPFGLPATEATSWAKQRIRDVARRHGARADLAEDECWRIVAGLRQASAFMPSTGAAPPSPPRKASPPRGLREIVTERGTVLPPRR